MTARDTSREEQLREIIREAIGNDLGLVERVEPDAALDTLLEAFRYACAEVARWRAWYGFADFGLTEAPDEQVQDVQEEFLGKARGSEEAA